MRRLWLKLVGITWSCPRCGRPFTSEVEMNLHYLSCGSSRSRGSTTSIYHLTTL